MTIYVINVGIGNFTSVKNMLGSIGIDSEIVEDIKDVKGPSGLILPGVGNFDGLMKKLKITGWSSFIRDVFEMNQYPILGICAGMQVFCEGSEEGNEPGLAIVPGVLKKFNFAESSSSLRVPHMGWNTVRAKNAKNNKQDINEIIKYYFLHSYYYAEISNSYVETISNYGIDFASSICNKNFYGVQFHPEKSHNFGKKFFKTLFAKEIKF